MNGPGVLFGGLEESYGLPRGILDTIWMYESSRGRNMLNPESGAKGHFQMMPANYLRLGIDPMDLAASANWSAQEAARAQGNFPNLDPVTAIAAQHYGGPNTGIWGPRTTEYVNRFRQTFGMDPISNYDLVAAAGGDPSRRSRDAAAARGASPMQPNIYDQGIPQQRPLLPAGPQQPLLGQPYEEPNLLTDPRFWANFAAGIDPQMLPGQALGAGLSNAFAQADMRKLAFDDRMYRQQQAQQTQAMREQEFRQKQLEWQREQQMMQEQAAAEEAYMQYLTPEEQAEFQATGKITRGGIELKPVVGPDGTPIWAPEEEAIGQKIPKKEPAFVGTPLETAVQQEAKRRIERISTRIGKNLDTAGDMGVTAARMQGQLESGLETGWWAPIVGDVQKAFGLSPEDVAKKEFFTSQAGEFLLQTIQQTKGSTSDKEMEYYQKLGPDITRSPGGNYLVLELAKRSAFRAEHMDELWGDYLAQVGERASWGDFKRWYYENHDPFPEWDENQILQDFNVKRSGTRAATRIGPRAPLGVVRGGSYYPPPPSPTAVVD